MTDAAPNAPVDAGQADQGQGQPAAQPQNQAPANQNWYDSFGLKPEDVGYIQNKAWDNPVKVIDAYRNLEKFHGVPADQIIKLPGKDAKPEQWDAVYNRLGRPEKPEGYGEFKAPEGVDMQLDSNRVKWADSVVHKLGLTKSQRDALLAETAKYEHGVIGEMGKQLEIEQTAQLNALKGEWGAAFNERTELGRRAAHAFLPGAEADKGKLLEAIEGAIGTAATLKLFANIGSKIGEDKVPDTNGTRPFGYSPEQARADIQQLKIELEGDKERLSVYNTGKGPDYDKMMKLMAVANGVK